MKAIAAAINLVCSSVLAAEIPVKVVRITDGDTTGVIDADKNYFKVRLSSIDAPESGQAFSTKSKEALAAKFFDREILLEEQARIGMGARLPC
jgi:micrococcal nuclease